MIEKWRPVWFAAIGAVLGAALLVGLVVLSDLSSRGQMPFSIGPVGVNYDTEITTELWSGDRVLRVTYTDAQTGARLPSMDWQRVVGHGPMRLVFALVVVTGATVGAGLGFASRL